MGALKFAFGAQYGRFYRNIKDIAKREGRCALPMLVDAVFCGVVLGSGLSDYLNYEFYRRSFKEKREYATLRNQDNFYAEVSPAQYKKVFTVKPNFLRAFEKYVGRSFVFPEDCTFSQVNDFLDANPVFMEKPIDGLGGYGVHKVRTDGIEDRQQYYAYLKENRIFIEQLIIQHPDMSALCENSVNTIRVMTSTTSGTPEIIFAGLRVGNGTADVDNFHSGGMGVLVDVESGRLTGDGINKNLDHFTRHPVTDILFDGYQLPFWDEVKAMVLEASLVEPRIKVIGWDVAITGDGPVFVEGNRRPGFDMVQVLYNRGRRDIMYKALSELRGQKKDR